MTAPLAPSPRLADAGAETGPTAPPAPPDDPSVAQMRELALRRAAFDFDLEERAELQREADALRDMMLAQLKAEDGYLHKWIEMI
jgi:hypothetical protein